MTAARVFSSDGAHWYHGDGRPCYELPKASGEGMKSPTLADARKLTLLPGVSTILRILHKEALVNWKIEQAVLAVLTSPRLAGESEDAYVTRILHSERVQDQEAELARDRGTDIHDAMETLWRGEEIAHEIAPWVYPAYTEIGARFVDRGVLDRELPVVGPGYGGRIDLITIKENIFWIIDYKSTKKLPEKSSWPEHVLQLAAYARAYQMAHARAGLETAPNEIRTANVYISTVEEGKFIIHENPDWHDAYQQGFATLVAHWQWANQYFPGSPYA